MQMLKVVADKAEKIKLRAEEKAMAKYTKAMGSRQGCLRQRVCSCRVSVQYRGYSKLRTHAALRPYGSSMPRSIGPS